MTYTVNPIQHQLGDVAPFDSLPTEALRSLASSAQVLRYRMGQPIVRRETMPHQVVLIQSGQVRLLGYDPYTKNPVTLKLLGPGDILGLAGLARGVACESAIASTEIVAVAIPMAAVQQLIADIPSFAGNVHNHCYLAELFDIISQYFEQQA
ncbi:MAG: cyclic nucleotide-binding domain-containing protein, partial [Cyanobacteria bacterium P01_A01_bin.37]